MPFQDYIKRHTLEVVAGIGVVVAAVGGLIWYFTRPALRARFAGFREELKNPGGETTTRQRDGATSQDFWHYPLIDLTPDIDGDFTVTWQYANRVNGAPEYNSEDIVNIFSGLRGGETVRLELRDTREPSSPNGVCNGVSCRDTRRGESIAYGDLEGLTDGQWHRFTSDISVLVVSPSDANVATSGLLDETFKTVRAFNVAFAGFNVTY